MPHLARGKQPYTNVIPVSDPTPSPSSETVLTKPAPGGWRAFIPDISPLRESRDFRWLYIGQFVSAFGQSFSYVVLPLQMWQLTHSSVKVGLLGLAEFVPMLLFAFLGGALADAVDRRKLVLGAEIGLMICSAVLTANALLPAPHVAVLFAMSSLAAACFAIHRPAHESLTPRLVAAEHMPAVAALSTFRFSFNFIVGPAAAGIIAATFGPAAAFGVNAVTYLVAIGTLLAIPPVPVAPGADRPSLRAVKAGVTYAASRQELLGTYLIDIIAMFFGMPTALFPALADNFGAGKVGLFYSAMAAGPMVVTLTSGWTRRVERHGLAILLAVVAWGLAIVGFGLARQLWLALLFLAVAGAADSVSGIFRMTIWNQTIPDRLRGRLASIELISYTTGPYLGNAEAGLVAGWFGLRASVVSGGVLCVLGAGAFMLLLPNFARYTGKEGLARKRAEEERGDATAIG